MFTQSSSKDQPVNGNPDQLTEEPRDREEPAAGSAPCDMRPAPAGGDGEPGYEPGGEAADASPPAESVPEADAAAGAHYVSIPISDIDPNEYNPNRQSEEVYAALVKETRRLGRNPAPITVRPKGGRYEIVNGAHNYRAAKEVGLAEVTCEIESIDDFEAMRQTLGRNRHGEHDPLLEGLVFQDMMKASGLSIRGLAPLVDLSPSKIRSALKYVQAAATRLRCKPEEVRTACALDEEGARKISALSKTQLDAYLGLPEQIRDRWLDAGANVAQLNQIFTIGNGLEKGNTMLERLTGFAWLHCVDFNNWIGSMTYLGEFAVWCSDRFILMHDVIDYVLPIVELKLPKRVLDLLPYEPAPEGTLQCSLPLETWTGILHRSCEKAKDKNSRYAIIAQAVRCELTRVGKDPTETMTQKQVDAWVEIHTGAAGFIVEADFLSIEERLYLHRATAHIPENLQRQAKERTIEDLRQIRIDGAGERKTGGATSVRSIFREHIDALEAEHRGAEVDNLFQDRDGMLKMMLECVAIDPNLIEASVDGLPALELLRRDLAELPQPMLAFVASYVMPTMRRSAVARYVEACERRMSPSAPPRQEPRAEDAK